MMKKIKNMELHKKRMIWFLLVMELFLLFVVSINIFKDRMTYQYQGNIYELNEISLPKGTYQVKLQYDTNLDGGSQCVVKATDLPEGYLFTNGAHLYANRTETNFEMWLNKDSNQIQVEITQGGSEQLEVTGIVFEETGAFYRIRLFWVALGVFIINLFVFLYFYGKKYSFSKKEIIIAISLFLISLIVSLPLFKDYMFGTGDLIYHLMRIEGIKDGLLQGAFPVRISPEWQQGYGYASPIFYCETLLYIAGILRIIGFSVLDTYRIFMCIIGIITVVSSYYCFKKIFKEEYVGVICSAVYSISIYRIYKTYVNGSFGETFAMIFLPFIIYGFYKVFTEDHKRKEYNKVWLPLTIGFTGLIQSHLLTCEIVGFFTIILCVILWKKVFRKETFFALAKTVIISCLLSAWFLIPFIDYMLHGDFIIQNVSVRTIQDRGLYLAHLFFAYPLNGGNVFFAETGMYESHATSLGMGLVLSLFIFLGLLFLRKLNSLKEQELAFGKILCLFTIVSMIMSLNMFPWDAIQFSNGILETLVSSLQFPNRFLTIATISMTAITGLIFISLKSNKRNLYLLGFCMLTLFLTLVPNIRMMKNLVTNGTEIKIYNNEGMGTGYIAGAEYLPYGADPSQFIYRDPLAEEQILIEEYEKKGTQIDILCQNVGGKEGAIELPLLYYEGYRAYNLETGENIPIYVGTNFVVGVAIPSGFDGTVRIEFQSPWYWLLGEWISVVAFISVVIYFWRKDDVKKIYTKE